MYKNVLSQHPVKRKDNKTATQFLNDAMKKIYGSITPLCIFPIKCNTLIACDK